MVAPQDFTIPVLGKPGIHSPIHLSTEMGDLLANYVFDDEFVLSDIQVKPDTVIHCGRENLLEAAGPREMIYFDPSKVHAGVVTCGGLCPGLNDVIRAIVMTLWYRYGVRKISGIRYGYHGLLPDHHLPVMELEPEKVTGIHQQGGTILGSSRGGGNRVGEIVDALDRMNMNILFTIGGDGTQKGAMEIAREACNRGMRLSVVGIPKTIDNDLNFIQKSFGFETAVARAVESVSAAHIEATGAMNGVGIVKLMGRESGFIAAYTTLAQNDVNYVLIPEVPFELEGENGLLTHLSRRLEERHHAVIVVAEGAGQNLMETAAGGTDPSGNRVLGDIGIFLKMRVQDYFRKKNRDVVVKYIDPSYIIRSAPAHPNDSIFCARLGVNAVHAAMAGKTELLVSQVNNKMVYLPIRVAVSSRNRIDPESPLWRDVLEATGQAPLMVNGAGKGPDSVRS